MAVVFTIAVIWLITFWQQSLVAAILGCLLALFFYAPVLGFQFLIARRLNLTDPAPQSSNRQSIQAWWTEVLVVARVFFWQQPFCAFQIPDSVDGPAIQRGRRGLVFVHGFICNRGLWNPWMRQLQGQGRAYTAVNLEPVLGSIDEYVSIVERAVSAMTIATGLPPVVICHSMGGLAARAWLRSDAANDKRVHHVVTIGTPHQGTWVGSSFVPANVLQMKLGSTWLDQLATVEPPERHKLFTCFYSNCDNIVFPTSTGTLAYADNRLIGGVAHLALVFDRQVMDESLAKL